MNAPLKPSEILERAGDLLAMPGAWTQGECARDSRGKGVSSDDTDAVCWCSIGALAREMQGPSSLQAMRYIRNAIGDSKITFWNDNGSRTQSEVVAAFRKAAALAREAG